MKIGVLGGGQLGRMLALAGIPMGLEFRFLEERPEAVRGLGECCTDLEEFARELDAVTFEFENVPLESVRWLEQRLPVWPSSRALEVSCDRLAEKEFLRSLSIPTAPYGPDIAYPALAKKRRLGYDGKGQRRIARPDELKEDELAEEILAFERELALLAVRSKAGEIRTYPLTETVHRDGILVKASAPAEGPFCEYARLILEKLDYVGVLALEMFEHQGRLLANELAPRVHNSGHWTIEGALTSQFENHLRAGLGWPLGDTKARDQVVMYNLIGELPGPERFPGAHYHAYGKAPRPGRKVGHVTLLGGGILPELEVACARSAP